MARHVEQGQSYLFKRDVLPSEIHHTLSSLAYILPTAGRYWYEMLDRRTPKDVVDGLRKIEKGESVREHALEGVQFSLDLVDNHKRANGLRAAALTHNIDPALLSVFGLDLTYAMNHADFTDHAIPHVRRIHRVMDHIILRVPELRHHASIRRWLPALELFPHNHDMDQVISLMRNKIKLKELDEAGRRSEFRAVRLTPKAAHGLAAAVMTMAMAERYQQEGGMTELDAATARHTAVAAAIMILKHEEPDKLDEALSEYVTIKRKAKQIRVQKFKGNNERYQRKTGLERLIEDFDKNRVDVFSLSPSQLVKILHHKKMLAGNFVSDGNFYGLHPQFVREYRRELRNLSDDTAPMLPHLTEDERESFILATKVAVFADEIEMIYPPYPSITRSLKTDISRNRRWWPKDATVEGMMAAIEKEGGNYKGEMSSDAYRLLWETWEMIHKAKRAQERSEAPIIDGSKKPFDLMTAPYVNQIMKEHVLMRLLAVREFGGRIMNGDVSVVDDIYRVRMEALTKKVVDRSKHLSLLERSRLKHRLHIPEVADAIRQKGEELLWDRFTFRVRVLNREAEELKEIIRHKPGWDEKDPHQTGVFLEMCDRLIGEACDVFSISEQEAREMEEKMLRGADFYKTYDPLGGLPDTIREPQHFTEWQGLLRGEIRGPLYWDLRQQAMLAEDVLYERLRQEEELKQQKRRPRGPTSQNPTPAQ